MDSDEYVFRFPVTVSEHTNDPDEMLRHFFTEQIKDLLKIVSIYENDKKILPTSFSFINDQDRRFNLWDKKSDECTCENEKSDSGTLCQEETTCA
jgi:hypothetical protein